MESTFAAIEEIKEKYTNGLISKSECINTLIDLLLSDRESIKYDLEKEAARLSEEIKMLS